MSMIIKLLRDAQNIDIRNAAFLLRVFFADRWHSSP